MNFAGCRRWCLPAAARWALIGLLLLGGRCFAASGQVRYVYDGDTIAVAGAQGEVVVRLVGIDAPETGKGKGQPGQPYSRKARKYLMALALDRQVRLVFHGMDVYGRYLAEVFLDGKNVNLAMVEAGFAEVYRGKRAESLDAGPYFAAERRARAAGKGIWRQGKHYVSPLDWKHRRRAEGKNRFQEQPVFQRNGQ